MASSSQTNQAKLDSELDKMRDKVMQGLVSQFRTSLQGGVQSDISFKLDGDFTCLNRCIVLLMAPDLSIGTNQEMIFSERDTIDSSQKDKLASLYKSNVVLDRDQIIRIFTDLDALFKSGVYSDIAIECNDGKKFDCHRCVLAAHSQYFEMMFHNSWKESNESLVKLNNVSSEVFGVILNFMYAAKVEIPIHVDAVSLILAQDLLNVKGFQDVLNLHFKAYYCHFFHSPCDSCIENLTNFYHLIVSYGILGYNDLVEACHKWFVRYFFKLINNRTILKVPKTVREVIVTNVKESINFINILPTLKECTKFDSLPNVKWAKEANRLAKDIEFYSMKFSCDNFPNVIKQPGFKMCVLEDKNLHMSKLILERLVNAIEINIDIQNCIKIYSCISSLNNDVLFQLQSFEDKDLDHSKNFIKSVLDLSKTFIKKNFIKLQRSQEWKQLPNKLKEEFKKSSGFIS